MADYNVIKEMKTYGLLSRLGSVTIFIYISYNFM